MKTTLSWINDYVDIKDVSVKEFVDKMTYTGSKVERVSNLGEDISGVVVGKIIELEKHPDADKLQVSKVDIGKEIIQVVTGAQNVKVGDYIPVATVGATLPNDIKIKKGKLRGVDSFGMMCSTHELNLTKDDFPNAADDGIFILEDNLPLGEDVKKIFNIDETVVEFEITSNRVDCFSIIGLAREAAAIFDKKLQHPKINIKEASEKTNDNISVEVLNNDYCKRYTSRVIKNVKVGESPKWLKDRLKGVGLRPINNIVDITNFVMMEMGQPMHAFDLSKIAGSKLIVRNANEGEKIITLDDVERKLSNDMLVIADTEKALAIAGIMGGVDSGISNETTDVVLECANFDNAKVRLASKKLGLRSDSSSLFEKGLNIDNLILALNRAASLISEIAGGEVLEGIIDSNKKEVSLKILTLDSKRINKLLGTDIPEKEMFNILRKLEFIVNEEEKTILVPSFRSDIENTADIAEEVARIYGYNNIKSTLLENVTPTAGGKTKLQKVEDKIKEVLISNGLNEILTYTFTSPKVFEKLENNSLLNNAWYINNPLGEDYSVMRTTPVPEMLTALALNHSKRNEKAHLFEISKVFIKTEEKKEPVEMEMINIGMYNNVDFYDLKGIVEEIFNELKIRDYEFLPCSDDETMDYLLATNKSMFHPGRCADVLVNGKVIGRIGEVHPIVAKNFKCPERTYIGVLSKKALGDVAKDREEYKKLPKFPAISRDISFVLPADVMIKQVEDILKQRGGKMLESFKLFDVYTGKQVGEGLKSVAYSLSFRASDRTLTDEEVAKTMKKIIDGLERNLNANLRD